MKGFLLGFAGRLTEGPPGRLTLSQRQHLNHWQITIHSPRSFYSRLERMQKVVCAGAVFSIVSSETHFVNQRELLTFWEHWNINFGFRAFFFLFGCLWVWVKRQHNICKTSGVKGDEGGEKLSLHFWFYWMPLGKMYVLSMPINIFDLIFYISIHPSVFISCFVLHFGSRF